MEEGMSVSDVAKVMGLSEAEVRSIERSAMQKIRLKFKQLGLLPEHLIDVEKPNEVPKAGYRVRRFV